MSEQPWERIAWSPEHEQTIYKDWALFYTHKQQLDIAARYYDKSLELKEDDHHALFNRSHCKRNIAQTLGALQDGRAASMYVTQNAPINLAICDALYELNQFEDCKVELHDNTRQFIGLKVAAFQNRLDVVDENFYDSIGDSLSPFILKNGKSFPAILEHYARLAFVDKRPLWKILKEQEKCDVLSILEKEEILLSPREIARRERGFKVFNQIYFNKSWIDVQFLKAVRKNKNLLFPQSKVSTPFLANLTATKYGIVRKFLKMLQARSPLYNEQMLKCPDKKVFEENREAHLNRIQYQTRRNMLTILRTVKQLRALGRVEQLSKYIEEVMGGYVVLKTYRVMPWKFEFVNEVYNTLALALADDYKIPESPLVKREYEPLLVLLHQPVDKGKDRTAQFIFGDRSTYQEPDAIDYSLIAYKRFLARLERRMLFATYPVEKCYLLHELARAHLKHMRYDECCTVARKAYEEAKSSRCYLWQFHSVMLMVKSHAILHKVERARDALEEALIVAGKLNNKLLTSFVELCRNINDEYILLKRRSQSNDSLRKHKSKSSMSKEDEEDSEVERGEAAEKTSEKPSEVV